MIPGLCASLSITHEQYAEAFCRSPLEKLQSCPLVEFHSFCGLWLCRSNDCQAVILAACYSQSLTAYSSVDLSIRTLPEQRVPWLWSEGNESDNAKSIQCCCILANITVQ